MNKLEKKKKFDYKWVVIGSCFLMVMVTLGFCSSPKSYFIGPITEHLGIDRSAYSINDSLRHITSALVNFFFGMLIKKFGSRKLIAAGFLALTASALCYALAENVWLLYLGGILLGAGLSWTTTTMVGYVVNKWAKENKGTIMGAVLAANGVGGAIAMNIVSPIIESKAEGYKLAYLLIAAILLVVGTLIVVLFRESPKGKENVAADIPKKKARGESWIGLEYSKVKRKWFFYGALICVFCTGLVLTACNGVAVQHMKDVGLDPAYVTAIWSVHSLVLAAFKFLTGFIYDKCGLRATMLICMLNTVIVVVCLAMVMPTPEGKILAAIYSVFSGLALPLETVMLPILAGDLFGQRAFDEILGLSVSINSIGYAVASPIMNICFDKLGSYKLGMLIAAALMVGVVILMQAVITSAHKTRKRFEAERAEVSAAEGAQN